jgi:hypothetical protein
MAKQPNQLVPVYRVEAPDGWGPYREETYPSFKIHTRHGPWNGRPGWDDDVPHLNPYSSTHETELKKYYAGFSSMLDLFKWFGGWLRVFYKTTDLRIVKYMVPANHTLTCKSQRQLIFIKETKKYKNHVAGEEFLPRVRVFNESLFEDIPF